MGKNPKQVSAFSLEGRFLSFEVEDGYKIKRLNLATADGEICVKLSKEARASVKGVLTPGDWIWVFGKQYSCPDTASIKYKAYLIKQAVPGQTPALTAPTPTEAKASQKSKPQATVLVCQKSDCMKRGGKAVCQALQATLSDRGLEGQVAIKGVGCMKECKAGPNLVVMPNKTRYSRIQAAEIPDLIDRHFPHVQAQEPSNSEFISLG
ncbi:MAG: (2Fe-2S) ferredoxin domain-containing protein [Oscillatoriales cyanobacterium C42_A2020_001]|nr:(2Fe-2S) ferredoxin domain-containing protein [Leptolyngbyaceae cyanobacterium C42_A2020_001]